MGYNKTGGSATGGQGSFVNDLESFLFGSPATTQQQYQPSQPYQTSQPYTTPKTTGYAQPNPVTSTLAPIVGTTVGQGIGNAINQTLFGQPTPQPQQPVYQQPTAQPQQPVYQQPQPQPQPQPVSRPVSQPSSGSSMFAPGSLASRLFSGSAPKSPLLGTTTDTSTDQTQSLGGDTGGTFTPTDGSSFTLPQPVAPTSSPTFDLNQYFNGADTTFTQPTFDIQPVEPSIDYSSSDLGGDWSI